VIDQAVVDFSAGIMDILMELAFGQAPPGDRWRDCGARLVTLAQALKESAPPDWVNPPTREHGNLESLVKAHLLLSMGSDSEDEKNPFPSIALHSNSLAGPSTSASAIAPGGQATATALPSSHQGLPARGMSIAVEIPQQQSQLKTTKLRTLTLTKRMSTTFLFIRYLIQSLLVIGSWSPQLARALI
jgi:hypothetical protein